MDITELFGMLLSDGEDRVELASIKDDETFAALVKFVKAAGAEAMAEGDIELAKNYGSILTAVKAAREEFAAEQQALADLAEAFAADEVIEEEVAEEAFEVEVEAETEEVAEVAEETLAVEAEEEAEVVEEEFAAEVVEEAAEVVEEAVSEELAAEEITVEDEAESLAQEGADMAQVDMEEFADATPAVEAEVEEAGLGDFAFTWMGENKGYTAGENVESLRDLADAYPDE